MPSGVRPDREVDAARRGGGFTGRGGMHEGSTGYKGGNAGGYRPTNPSRYGPRYEKRTVKSFAPTASNLAQVAGTVLGALGGPIGTALNAGASAIAGVNPMEPFERPTGTVDSFSYDPANRALGAENPLISKTSATRRVTRPKKKMVGYTLLEGAGGVLSGS